MLRKGRGYVSAWHQPIRSMALDRSILEFYTILIACLKPDRITFSAFASLQIPQIGQLCNQQLVPQVVIDFAADIVHTGTVITHHKHLPIDQLI